MDACNQRFAVPEIWHLQALAVKFDQADRILKTHCDKNTKSLFSIIELVIRICTKQEMLRVLVCVFGLCWVCTNQPVKGGSEAARRD